MLARAELLDEVGLDSLPRDAARRVLTYVQQEIRRRVARALLAELDEYRHRTFQDVERRYGTDDAGLWLLRYHQPPDELFQAALRDITAELKAQAPALRALEPALIFPMTEHPAVNGPALPSTAAAKRRLAAQRGRFKRLRAARATELTDAQRSGRAQRRLRWALFDGAMSIADLLRQPPSFLKPLRIRDVLLVRPRRHSQAVDELIAQAGLLPTSTVGNTSTIRLHRLADLIDAAPSPSAHRRPRIRPVR